MAANAASRSFARGAIATSRWSSAMTGARLGDSVAFGAQSAWCCPWPRESGFRGASCRRASGAHAALEAWRDTGGILVEISDCFPPIASFEWRWSRRRRVGNSDRRRARRSARWPDRGGVAGSTHGIAGAARRGPGGRPGLRSFGTVGPRLAPGRSVGGAGGPTFVEAFGAPVHSGEDVAGCRSTPANSPDRVSSAGGESGNRFALYLFRGIWLCTPSDAALAEVFGQRAGDRHQRDARRGRRVDRSGTHPRASGRRRGVLGLHALKRCVPAAQLPPAQSPRR